MDAGGLLSKHVRHPDADVLQALSCCMSLVACAVTGVINKHTLQDDLLLMLDWCSFVLWHGRVVSAVTGAMGRQTLQDELLLMLNWCRFVLGHHLVASAVTGAMNKQQLAELLDIAEQPALDQSILDEIDAIHDLCPNPCP